MRRQSLAKGILTATTVLLTFVSCQTTKVTTAVSSNQGYLLTGTEAAAFYAKELAEAESVELRYNYCYSLFEGEAYQECKEEIAAAIALYPNHLRFYYLQVLTAEKLQDDNYYTKALDMVLELNPVDSEVLHRKLQSLKDKGRIQEATEIAKRILDLNAKDVDALNLLGENSDFYRYLAESTNHQ